MADEMIRFSSEVGGARESIAESHILEQISILLRDLEEEYRELLFMVRDLDEGKAVAVEKRYARVRNIKQNIEANSINIMEYIIKLSPTLLYKDVYVDIVQGLVRTAENAEAASYRNLLLNSKEFEKLPDKTYAILEGTIKKILNMIELIDSMVSKIGTNHKQLRDLYVELIKAEDAVDDYYRESGIEIIRHYSKDVGSLILIKEIFDKLEDAADILKQVGTYIRYISLHR